MQYDELVFDLKNINEEEIETELLLYNFLNYVIFTDTTLKFLKIYFPRGKSDKNVINIIKKQQPVLVASNCVDDQDWVKIWKENIKPFHFTHDIWINPDGKSNFIPPPGHRSVSIIPGAAFGTGLHATTRLAAGHLINNIKKNDSVLDIGCGTGILSVIAGYYGAGRILAIDNDLFAVEKVAESAALNNINIEIRESNMIDNVKQGEKFNIIIANIISAVLLELLNYDLHKYSIPGGIIIFSGIAENNHQEVIRKIKNKGYSILSEKRDETWLSLIFN